MIIYDGIIYSIQKYGGISNYFTNLINNYSNNSDIENKLILYGNPLLSENISANLSNSKYRYFERYRNINNIPDNDILHSSYYRTSINKKVKNVITLYDFTYEKYNKKIYSIPHIHQKKKAIQRADAIICISENTKRDLLTFYPYIEEDKIFITHLAAGAEYIPLNISYENRISSPYAIFIGPRSGYKNFNTVIDALEINKNVSLYVIGGGNLTKTEVSLLNNKLKNRYSYRGYVDSDELNKLYNNAICLLYPSLYEGFGIPILEAQNASCPVICNNISSVPEVAGDGAILLDACTPESIALSIDKIFNKEEFLSLKRKGHNNCSRFSWQKTGSQTMEVYKNFI